MVSRRATGNRELTENKVKIGITNAVRVHFLLKAVSQITGMRRSNSILSVDECVKLFSDSKGPAWADHAQIQLSRSSTL